MPTKIIATIWKKPFDTEKVTSIIHSGADIVRLKCSHMSLPELAVAVQQTKDLIVSLGTDTKILADLPEAKIRLGELETQKELAEKGNRYTLRSCASSPTIQSVIPIAIDAVGTILHVGQSIVVGDGSVFFRVVEIVDDSTVQVEAENTGLVIRCAGVTFPDASPKEHLTDETWEMIRLLVPIKPEYLAFSFVESADMMRRIKARVKEIAGDTWSPLIVAKIESKSGVINAKEIAQEADALMVARGDLALAIPIATLPRTQRMLCETARECGIPSIVATNILDSMENSPLPSRADVGDLTGIIRDGADYAMLCRSTAHTENPGAVVKMAKEIILDLSGGDST